GASDDIRRATELARRMVCEWGMSSEIGPIHYAMERPGAYLGSESSPRNYSEATALQIDKEIRAILDGAYKRTEKLITQHRDSVEAIAKALMQYETLSGADVQRVLDGDEPTEAIARIATETKPPAPALVLQPERSPAEGGIDPLDQGLQPGIA
ncbi:MAG: ATP-dependent zinc metalloprotease FtsH, partial [Planctomycetota bacterium]